jgi:hypothetical protein
MLELVSAWGRWDAMSETTTCLIVLFAISIAFWRLGSPVGSNLCRSEIALSTSGGFPENRETAASVPVPPTKHATESIHKPDISPTRSPTPALMPTIPI